MELKTSYVIKEGIFNFGPGKIIRIQQLSDGTYLSSTPRSDPFSLKQLQESERCGENNEFVKLPFTLDWDARISKDVLKVDKYMKLLEHWKKTFYQIT